MQQQKILLIDNLDSFTYNIVDGFERLGVQVIVSADTGPAMTHLILGPGPGSPSNHNIDILRSYLGKVPILGICLGHQTIGAAFGASIIRAKEPCHGKTFSIMHDSHGLFKGLPSPLLVTRYHSLIIERKSLPSCLEVSAITEDGEIMAVRHKQYALEGVQFHPEAISSTYGNSIFKNFLETNLLDQKETKYDNLSL